MAAQSLVSVRFEKTKTPARFEPMPTKNTQTECFTSPLEPIKNNNKKQSFGSETPERQQQSSLCQAKNCSKRTYNHKQERGFRTMAAQSLVGVRFEKTETPARFEPIKNNAFVRFHNSQTPARFEPMPNKKHDDRMLHVTFGTYNPLKI